jgi:hypothetical protein
MEAFMATALPVFLARSTTSSQEPAQPSSSSRKQAFEADEWDRWVPSEAPLVPSWNRFAPLTPKPSQEDPRFVPLSPKAWQKEPEPEEPQPQAWQEGWQEAWAWQEEHQPEACPSASQEEPQPSSWRQKRPLSLPKRKIEAGELIGARPKQKSKPLDSDDFPRAVKSRSAEDRASSRSDEDNQQRPWDTRGPRGPQDGGPKSWKGQKFREGSGRWANSGGQHRDKYALYHKKQREGVTNVSFYHPFAEDGYWAKKAAEDGVPSPFQMRQGR